MHKIRELLSGDEHEAMTKWCAQNIYFTDWSRQRVKKRSKRWRRKGSSRVDREWRVIEIRWRGRHTVYGEIIPPSIFKLWCEQHPIVNE